MIEIITGTLFVIILLGSLYTIYKLLTDVDTKEVKVHAIDLSKKTKDLSLIYGPMVVNFLERMVKKIITIAKKVIANRKAPRDESYTKSITSSLPSSSKVGLLNKNKSKTGDIKQEAGANIQWEDDLSLRLQNQISPFRQTMGSYGNRQQRAIERIEPSDIGDYLDEDEWERLAIQEAEEYRKQSLTRMTEIRREFEKNRKQHREALLKRAKLAKGTTTSRG